MSRMCLGADIFLELSLNLTFDFSKIGRIHFLIQCPPLCVLLSLQSLNFSNEKRVNSRFGRVFDHLDPMKSPPITRLSLREILFIVRWRLA